MAVLAPNAVLGSQLFELIHQLDLVNPLLSSVGENHVGLQFSSCGSEV